MGAILPRTVIHRLSSASPPRQSLEGAEDGPERPEGIDLCSHDLLSVAWHRIHGVLPDVCVAPTSVCLC